MDRELADGKTIYKKSPSYFFNAAVIYMYERNPSKALAALHKMEACERYHIAREHRSAWIVQEAITSLEAIALLRAGKEREARHVVSDYLKEAHEKDKKQFYEFLGRTANEFGVKLKELDKLE